ncbi:PEP-CTERM sorting domain-containing protein [Roseiconus lacunae]|uniref:PEP-CTERM sorting domain-containing protein n=1 Tax=Roseiconus lacunae TaxID=2605694 RepID=UPI0011F1E19C|nr:PEP-CTERM sorting domain-containing protein [Roseiconus lacunae]
MNIRFFAILASFCLTSISYADVVVSFSTSASDPNAGTVLTLNEGQTSASLFVYVENTEATTIEGLSLDILSDTPGIALATSHLISEPAGRWFGSTPGALGSGPFLVDDSNAFNFFGGFPNSGGPQLHSEIVLDAIGIGSTQVTAATGGSGIAVGGQVPSSLSFGTATVNVVTAIPEPGSALALSAIVGGMLIRRRKIR